MLECPSLLSELQRLTLRLSEIVKRDFSDLESSLMNWKPSDEKWSIAQCLLHLNCYADYYFPSTQKMIKKAQKRGLQATSHYKKGRYGRKCIADVRLQRDNQIRATLEATTQVAPTASQIDGKKELEKFLFNQQKLCQMITAAKQLPLGLVRIPFDFWGLYRIRLGDLLQVFVYHTERHIVQAQRVHYHDNFPYSNLDKE